MHARWKTLFAAFVLSAGAQPTPTPAPAGTDDLYNLGQQLFDQYAPPEVKDQYRFPTKDEWDRFAARLQHALDSNSLEELAEFEPEARAALVALRALPGYEDYADWLALRIDEIDAARLAVARPGRRPRPARPGSGAHSPRSPTTTSGSPASAAAPSPPARRSSCRSFGRRSRPRASRRSSRG